MGAVWACASVPKPSPIDHLYQYDAFTVWSCSRPRPAVFYGEGALVDGQRYRAVRAHEAGHVLFMLGFGSCEAWEAWNAQPSARLIAEAFAFCAQIRQEAQDGIPVDSALTLASRALALDYGFGITPEAARKRIVGVCM